MRMAKATDYVDNGDGTVTDARTGLMWKQFAEGQSGEVLEGTAGKFNWNTAMGIPQTVNQSGGFAGYNDWRVPTRHELESLVMDGRMEPAICTEAFPKTPVSYVWSSSPGIYSASDAWCVDLHSGYADLESPRYGLGVRLVRGGQ